MNIFVPEDLTADYVRGMSEVQEIMVSELLFLSQLCYTFCTSPSLYKLINVLCLLFSSIYLLS